MPDPTQPSRRTVVAACAAMTAVCIAVCWHRSDPLAGMSVTVDSAHQLFILNWLKTALFEGGGDPMSPPMFYPSTGTLATTEVPVLQSVIFSLFRHLGAVPFLAWNITYAFFAIGNLLAAFAALRSEKVSFGAAITGALVFAAAANWLRVNTAIWYMTAFGIPLSWYFLNRIRDERRPAGAATALAAVLLLQLLSGITITIAALLLISIRTVTETSLRKNWPFIAFALSPVVAAGTAWALTCRNLFSEWDGFTHAFYLQSQIDLRIDLTDLIPFVPRERWFPHAGPWRQSAWGEHEQYIGAPLPVLALILTPVILRLKRAGETAVTPPPRKRNGVAVTLYALAALFAVHVIVPPVFHDPLNFSPALWAFTDLVIACAALAAWKWGDRLNDGNGPVWLAGAGIVALGLGPVIFAGGKPLLIGPLAVLDIMVPGFERLRVPGRLLLAAAMPLAVVTARSLDKLALLSVRLPVIVATLTCFWILSAPNMGPALWPPTRYRQDDVSQVDLSVPPQACPACKPGDTVSIPLPYRYLQSIGSPPIVEIPSRRALPNGQFVYDQSVYLYYAALDGIPRANGIGAMLPAGYRDFEDKLGRFPSSETVDTIRSHGIGWVVLNGQKYPADEWRRLQADLSPPPDGLEITRTWAEMWLLKLSGRVNSPPEAPPAFPTGN